MKKFCVVNRSTFRPRNKENTGKGACLGTMVPHSFLVHNLLAIQTKALFLKQKM